MNLLPLAVVLPSISALLHFIFWLAIVVIGIWAIVSIIKHLGITIHPVVWIVVTAVVAIVAIVLIASALGIAL